MYMNNQLNNGGTANMHHWCNLHTDSVPYKLLLILWGCPKFLADSITLSTPHHPKHSSLGDNTRE